MSKAYVKLDSTSFFYNPAEQSCFNPSILLKKKSKSVAISCVITCLLRNRLKLINYAKYFVFLRPDSNLNFALNLKQK